jgi:hypothetical protein
VSAYAKVLTKCAVLAAVAAGMLLCPRPAAAQPNPAEAELRAQFQRAVAQKQQAARELAALEEQSDKVIQLRRDLSDASKAMALAKPEEKAASQKLYLKVLADVRQAEKKLGDYPAKRQQAEQRWEDASKEFDKLRAVLDRVEAARPAAQFHVKVFAGTYVATFTDLGRADRFETLTKTSPRLSLVSRGRTGDGRQIMIQYQVNNDFLDGPYPTRERAAERLRQLNGFGFLGRIVGPNDRN